MTKMSEERSQRFSRPEERLIDDGKEDGDKLNLEDVDVWKLAEFFSGFMMHWEECALFFPPIIPRKCGKPMSIIR